ncbi:shikimate kinase, partial [Mycobacterium tuberculosis]
MAPKAVLVGLPGSGKSTIGRRLAKALGVGLLDTDVAIEQRTGRSIADIFATDGEQEFRLLHIIRGTRRARGGEVVAEC